MLSAQTIQGYMSSKLQDGLAPVSVHTHYRVLRAALGHAVKWGRLNRNPAAMADPPLARRNRPTVWDEEQVRLFLAEAKRSSRYYPLYLTAILTGMRQGELLGLRWRDVDSGLGVASIRQTLYRLGGSKKEDRPAEVTFKAPKRSASQRAVALPRAVVDALLRLREERGENIRLLGTEYQDLDLVFCQADGKPLHAHNVVRCDFHTVTARAGLPRIRFHDLRHAHASYLARAEVSPKVAQERLGHATPGFTMQVYTHVLAGQQEVAARAVELHLLGRDPAAPTEV